MSAARESKKIPDNILSSLQLGHPRLLASAQDFAALRQKVSSEAIVRQQYDSLQKNAEEIFTEPPCQYVIPDGLRLLDTSRRVMNRIYVLALMYRLSEDRRYADRAWQELEATAAFKDWNPIHFLDTAEMTNAFAIGYDWLYDAWTPAQRIILRDAIVTKGLHPALFVYQSKQGWPKVHDNWNQVCNGGIGLGALAVAEDVPDLAKTLLQYALASLPLAMQEFAPDGAWSEGPVYWEYATAYNVIFIAALQSVLGTDFGLSTLPGFSVTGDFPIYTAGPTGKWFNYADGGGKVEGIPQLFWLARRFHQPGYAAYQMKYAPSHPHPLNLLWGTSWIDAKMQALPLDRHFQKVEIASFRSAWDDPKALFVGFKAGDNNANHSHLDLGSFVLDARGYRWALDLGADNYNLPEYFSGKRWTYYRMRAEGHNTLLINPGAEPDQNPKAFAPMTRFESGLNGALAIADLTAAYAKQADRVQRGLILQERKYVVVQDEIQTSQPSVIWWFMHTQAEITLSDGGKTAVLAQGEEQLVARILSPKDAVFEIMAAHPLPTSPNPSGQNKNDELHKLTIRLSNVTEARISVVLTPLAKGEALPEPPLILPLADWAI